MVGRATSLFLLVTFTCHCNRQLSSNQTKTNVIVFVFIHFQLRQLYAIETERFLDLEFTK